METTVPLRLSIPPIHSLSPIPPPPPSIQPNDPSTPPTTHQHIPTPITQPPISGENSPHPSHHSSQSPAPAPPDAPSSPSHYRSADPSRSPPSSALPFGLFSRISTPPSVRPARLCGSWCVRTVAAPPRSCRGGGGGSW